MMSTARLSCTIAIILIATNPLNVLAIDQFDTKNVAESADVDVQRLRIERERTEAQTRFDAADLACDARFMRSDCVNAAKLARRQTLDDLRRQELTLSDRERKLRAGEVVERRDGRNEALRIEKQRQRAIEATAQDQSRRQRAAQRQGEDAQRAVESKQNQATLQMGRTQRLANRQQNTQRKAADAQAALMQQQAKEKKYADRRDALQQRLAKRTAPPAAPLEMPPPRAVTLSSLGHVSDKATASSSRPSTSQP